MSMDIDDFVEQCEQHNSVQSKNYAECFALFNSGMIYACHQLMLKNIDNGVDLGAKQSNLYDAIKREHTLVFTKSEKIKTSDKWTESTVSEKGKGSDDVVKIYQDSENSSTFMIDLSLDAGPVQAIARGFVDERYIHVSLGAAVVGTLAHCLSHREKPNLDVLWRQQGVCAH